ncbi:uncharacterized protein LOC130949566 [Arachis stenosperma]|uniref:uncharacterized protein LOC130949566 n=1 Tax=Arachis stenosperma TaxID=217475 RepID=UPI0025AD1C4F|nr:uncharacterized protein LOC130949566 [Arachis stenosperma]
MATHAFPSDTMANRRGKCKAITLRSRRVVEEATPGQRIQEEKAAREPETKKEEETPAPSSPKQVLKPYVPKAPYPQRLQKDGKDSQFSRFLEIFKKLQINIPFSEAIEQMSLYAIFLKELMTGKRNWGEKETIVLTEECSAIIKKKLPQKLKDPGSFQIPCIIGDMNIEKALCDLGTSINLMSLAMKKMMRIEEAKPTRLALQLADRIFKFPHGVVEDFFGQRKDKLVHDIYYASKVLNENQRNYTTTEKELLAISFTFDKFKSYLIGSKVTIFTDHAAFKYLLTKQESKPRLIRWVLFLEEFNIEIKDRSGAENKVADYLSRIPHEEDEAQQFEVNESFPDEQLMMIQESP